MHSALGLSACLQFSRFNNTNTSQPTTLTISRRPSRQTTPYQATFRQFPAGSPSEGNARFSSHVPRWNRTITPHMSRMILSSEKNLTFNLGFRFDVDTPRHEATARSLFWTSTLKPRRGRNSGALIYRPNATGAKTYYKNFGPRIGFCLCAEKIIRPVQPDGDPRWVRYLSCGTLLHRLW